VYQTRHVGGTIQVCGEEEEKEEEEEFFSVEQRFLALVINYSSSQLLRERL
jgi:hypothetical protein